MPIADEPVASTVALMPLGRHFGIISIDLFATNRKKEGSSLLTAFVH